MDLRKDTLFFDALVDFPTYGQEDKLYLDKANGALYYWDGSAYALAGDGTGGVTSVTASSPLSSTEGATPNISITQANGSTNGYLSSTDWTTFNGKQNAITLTTTGTSGAATLVGSTLNIPQYAGGLTYFTEAQNTSAPNATVPVDSLTAVAGTTNADIAIVPKGTGAFTLAVADNTATGGNKRGAGAVDLQLYRGASGRVASGANSFAAGKDNTASGANSVCIGSDGNATNTNSIMIGRGTCSGAYALAAGYLTSANGTNSLALGYGNTASGSESTAIGTYSANATASYAIAIGREQTASADAATAIGGQGNVASAQRAMAIGNYLTANGEYSLALGFRSHVFGIYGRQTYASGNESTDGDSQVSKFILRERTTGNTATTLTSNSSAASTNNQVILSNNSAYRFKGTIIGKQSGSTNAAAWDVDGLIVRGANASATTLLISNVTLVQNTPAWGTPTLAADTTNGGLRVQVTGAAATNIQWTAVIETTEVIYA